MWKWNAMPVVVDCASTVVHHVWLAYILSRWALQVEAGHIYISAAGNLPPSVLTYKTHLVKTSWENCCVIATVKAGRPSPLAVSSVSQFIRIQEMGADADRISSMHTVFLLVDCTRATRQGAAYYAYHDQAVFGQATGDCPCLLWILLCKSREV